MNISGFGSNNLGSIQILGGGLLLILLLGTLNGCIGLKGKNKVLTHTFSEPLEGAANAKIDIRTRNGNLAIGSLAGNEEILVSGSLQYVENQGRPAPSVNLSNSLATFSLRSDAVGKARLPLPWRNSKGALEWQININPAVPAEIILYSGIGNIKADLAGMAITHVSADSGGGDVEVILPEGAADLSVLAKSGGGNVTVEIGRGLTGKNVVTAQTGGGKVVVHLPSGLAARITATTGWGKVLVDPAFGKMDEKTYQSPEYEAAADTVEIILASGAGDVTVDIR
jgi:hypothetical protein